jgi:hypothetical protein
MFDPDAENPYRQPPLPYQPYKGNPAQQQQFVPPSPLRRDGSSHVTPTRPSQAKSAPPRLSKAEALAFVGKCKIWLVAGSFVAFGILSGLVAGHVVGATSNQATPANQADPASNAPAAPPSSGGGFFQQQQGGSGFGNTNPSQPPVSGSHTS